jgi:hypothetical protein
MMRAVYQFIVWMHPPAFRQRFGDEMMSVFDEAAGSHSFTLMLDGLLSLGRQWLLRTGAWKLLIAVSAASTQFLGFGFTMKGLQRPAKNGQVLTPTMQQVMFFALVLTCGLFIVVAFLNLWNTRFQRRRSTDYKRFPRSVSRARSLHGRK